MFIIISSTSPINTNKCTGLGERLIQMPTLGPLIYGQKTIIILHFVFVNTTICVCNSKV